MSPLPALLIAKKRDGERLSESEICDLVAGITDGSISDAQCGALLMAGLLRGSDDEEAAYWTRAMRDSGLVYDLSRIPGRKVDKHSTGGVGDKVSLVLAPLVASCGVAVPMVSGRGLGHTGGTVDKLEAISGFSMDLSPNRFLDVLEGCGFAMSAATSDLAPADRRLYALRDVTGTIECVAWITASILSKKLATGIDALVLDVKCGRGAFMKQVDDARELADSLVRTAELCGCSTRARITNMDQPLGAAIGNALEVTEAVEALRGGGPDDLRECVLLLGADMCELGGVAKDAAEARTLLQAAFESGRALERFGRLVELQGGDPRVVDEPEAVLPHAPVVGSVQATCEGFVADIDPLALGLVAVELGAGRRVATERVDPAVGIVCRAKPGDRVEHGEELARVHARDEDACGRAVARLHSAILVSDDCPERQPLLLA